jgi:hypothetical protein
VRGPRVDPDGATRVGLLPLLRPKANPTILVVTRSSVLFIS